MCLWFLSASHLLFACSFQCVEEILGYLKSCFSREPTMATVCVQQVRVFFPAFLSGPPGPVTKYCFFLRSWCWWHDKEGLDGLSCHSLLAYVGPGGHPPPSIGRCGDRRTSSCVGPLLAYTCSECPVSGHRESPMLRCWQHCSNFRVFVGFAAHKGES